MRMGQKLSPMGPQIVDSSDASSMFLILTIWLSRYPISTHTRMKKFGFMTKQRFPHLPFQLSLECEPQGAAGFCPIPTLAFFFPK